MSRTSLVLALLLASVAGLLAVRTWVVPPPAVLGPRGAALDPFADGADPVVVLVFTQSECPIANRYAPELRALDEEFDARGVDLWLVYPDPDDDEARVREHLEEYDLDLRAALDPEQRLVELAGARVTPEAAVFVNGEGPVYRGRISDRFVDFGVARREARRHDLREALLAVLEGRAIEVPETRAVGCYIPELRG